MYLAESKIFGSRTPMLQNILDLRPTIIQSILDPESELIRATMDPWCTQLQRILDPLLPESRILCIQWWARSSRPLGYLVVKWKQNPVKYIGYGGWISRILRTIFTMQCGQNNERDCIWIEVVLVLLGFSVLPNHLHNPVNVTVFKVGIIHASCLQVVFTLKFARRISLKHSVKRGISGRWKRM